MHKGLHCPHVKNETMKLVNDNVITYYIDASRKHIKLNSDTAIGTTNIDFKDVFLASLYRNQLEEKYLLIKTLIINDGEIQLKDKPTITYQNIEYQVKTKKSVVLTIH